MGREFGARDDGCLYQPPRANAAGRTSTLGGESGVINPRQSQFQTNHAQPSHSTNEQTGNVICDVYLVTDQTQPLKSGHSPSKLNQDSFVCFLSQSSKADVLMSLVAYLKCPEPLFLPTP